MSATLLTGKSVADPLKAETAARAERFLQAHGRAPKLALLLAAPDDESLAYARRQEAACRACGLDFEAVTLEPGEGPAQAETALQRLSADPKVDGILLARPLPAPFDTAALLRRLAPAKDVEGATPEMMGRLFSAKTYKEALSGFVPCTAEAVVRLLLSSGVSPAGKDAVVAGRSNVVGKPAAHLLTCLDATVTLCHTKTPDLAARAARADIVVAATTVAGWLKAVRPGAVVLDAGTHYGNGPVRGDAAPEVAAQAGFLTPVPGGVGPVTVAVLLEHVVSAAERAHRRA